ncbi:MAG: hypothetical protein HY720_27110 [Planctomycetes bacterium]|nr:hypothetical protein [Planctomycetota bacterium]
MPKIVRLDVAAGAGSHLRLEFPRHRSVTEVLGVLRGAIPGVTGRRLELYYGNSKLKPDHTFDFLLQAYGIAAERPVSLRLEDFDAGPEAEPTPDKDAPPPAPPPGEEVVLLEEEIVAPRAVGEADPGHGRFRTGPGPASPPTPPAVPDPGAHPRPASPTGPASASPPAPRPASRGTTARRMAPGAGTSYRIEIERPDRLCLGRGHRLSVHLRPLTLPPANRTISIRVQWPGCLVQPEEALHEGRDARHEFHVTPLAAGRLPGASIRLQVRGGRTADVPTPVTVRSASAGGLLVLFGALLPLLALAAEAWVGAPPATRNLEGYAALLGGLLMFAGLARLLLARPRRAPPSEQTVVL